MNPFLQFLIRRLFFALASLIVITMVLYGGVMLTPPEARAQLYIPKGKGGERVSENYIASVIKTHHLDEPYLVQYGYWVESLLEGTWGYSPTLKENVLEALLRRTPPTLELTLYSLLVFVPLGLGSGLIAGWKPRSGFDRAFRSLAYLSASMPPFILALLLLSVFYVRLNWFAPGRLDILLELNLAREGYRAYTNLLTIDSLLNGRFDIFLNALRHLAMPVMTLVIFHWATLGRITRAMVIGERRKEYLLAAKGRGISERKVIWKHALRSILAPSLTGIALSAAGIVTGVMVVEVIFSIHGVSFVIVQAMSSQPDAPAALGFAVYSVIMVISLMFFLDVLQALFDPRVREETLKS